MRGLAHLLQHGQAMPLQPWSVRRFFSVVFMESILSQVQGVCKANHPKRIRMTSAQPSSFSCLMPIIARLPHCKRAGRKLSCVTCCVKELTPRGGSRRGSCQSKLRKHFLVELPLSLIERVRIAYPSSELFKLLAAKLRGAAKDLERKVSSVISRSFMVSIIPGWGWSIVFFENISIHSWRDARERNSRSVSERSGKRFGSAHRCATHQSARWSHRGRGAGDGPKDMLVRVIFMGAL